MDWINLAHDRHTWDDGSEIDVKEMGMFAWTGLIWLMIGTNSGLLLT